jgi:hypothetical protein
MWDVSWVQTWVGTQISMRELIVERRGAQRIASLLLTGARDGLITTGDCLRRQLPVTSVTTEATGRVTKDFFKFLLAVLWWAGNQESTNTIQSIHGRTRTSRLTSDWVRTVPVVVYYAWRHSPVLFPSVLFRLLRPVGSPDSRYGFRAGRRTELWFIRLLSESWKIHSLASDVVSTEMEWRHYCHHHSVLCCNTRDLAKLQGAFMLR